MTRTEFGKTRDGQTVEKITLSNDAISVSILTLGAIVQDVRLPGVDYGLTLGSDQVAAYEGPLISYGSLIGPVVNRISGARATLNGQDLNLEKNFLGKHTLHSGTNGTHTRIWTVADCTDDRLCLTLDLADGDCHLPANRRITVTYQLAGAAVSFRVQARCDAPTLMNLANHSYWNLDGTSNYAGHRLSIAADRYLPATDELIPTGQILPVARTAFDFRSGRVLAASDAEFYDHNFCVSDARRALTPVARLTGTSGISLGIETTEPGLQLYDGGTMNGGGYRGHLGAVYGPYHGLALETQLWPDAPANPDFPSIVLDPGTEYDALTRYSLQKTAP